MTSFGAGLAIIPEHTLGSNIQQHRNRGHKYKIDGHANWQAESVSILQSSIITPTQIPKKNAVYNIGSLQPRPSDTGEQTVLMPRSLTVTADGLPSGTADDQKVKTSHVSDSYQHCGALSDVRIAASQVSVEEATNVALFPFRDGPHDGAIPFGSYCRLRFSQMFSIFTATPTYLLLLHTMRRAHTLVNRTTSQVPAHNPNSSLFHPPYRVLQMAILYVDTLFLFPYRHWRRTMRTLKAECLQQQTRRHSVL